MHSPFITNVRYILTGRRERRICLFIIREAGLRYLISVLRDPYVFG